MPLPEQPAFKSDNAVMCPVAEDTCQKIVSLPLYPQLNDDAVDRIIETVNDFDRTSHR
tara:strand:- start:696 stop:869 length:174 start_codon:yes stop_codon:yes gene_type:complete